MKVNNKFLAWKQYRLGRGLPDKLENGLNPDFYPQEDQKDRPCFENAHATAWRWHEVTDADIVSVLFDAVNNALEVQLVEDLNNPNGVVVQSEKLKKLLLKVISKKMKPGQHRKFDDRAERGSEKALYGVRYWGFGRKKDGTPFVVPKKQSIYVCHETRGTVFDR